jgi:hypothetical protein
VRPRLSGVSDGVEMVEVGETGWRGWGCQSDGEVKGSGDVAAGGRAAGGRAAGGRAAGDLPGEGHCWMAGVTFCLGAMVLSVVSGC